jgi:hypothetical protein
LAPGELPGLPEDPAPVAPEALAQAIQTALADLVVEQAWSSVLHRGLSDTNPEDLPLYRREFLRPLYEANHFLPLFANPTGGLGGRAEPLLGELRVAYQHALDVTPYRLPRLAELEERLRGQTPLTVDLTVDPSELARLALAAQDEDGTASDVARLAARRAVGLEGEARSPALAQVYEASRRQLADSLGDELAFELNAVHAFLSYAYDMAHANTNDLTPEVVREQGGPVAVQRDRLRESFRAAAGASPEAFAGQLEALVPDVPQYPGPLS